MLFDPLRRVRRKPAAALELGIRRREKGDLTGAADAFAALAALGDRRWSSRGSLELGRTLTRLGDQAGAAEAWRAAADSGHPDHAPVAALLLGELHGEKDREKAALALRKAVDSRHPEAAPKAALTLAELRERQGDLDTAEFLYSRAMDSRHPDAAPTAAYRLGTLLRRRGQPDRAQDALRTAARSGHPEVAGLAGIALAELAAPPPEEPLPSASTLTFVDRATGDRVASDPGLLEALLTNLGRTDLLHRPWTGAPAPSGGYEITFHEPHARPELPSSTGPQPPAGRSRSRR